MEKERNRAIKNGYESPIHNTKKECDRDFNLALEYCIKNIEEIEIFQAHTMKIAVFYSLN